MAVTLLASPQLNGLDVKKDKAIYVDFSILSAFRLCEEKARLMYIEHYRPKKGQAYPLSFGSAFHAGVAAFHNPHGWLKDSNINYIPEDINKTSVSKTAFVREVRATGLPIAIDNSAGYEGKPERRSVERGLYLLEAYQEKWSNEMYVTVNNDATNEPLVEIGFALYVREWQGIPVIYVGRVDRIAKSRLDGNLWIVETKTTTKPIRQHVKEIRPNHQLTGYKWMANELLGLRTAGVVWDSIYVSSRQPNPKENGWLALGVDIDKDFARTETRRSDTDIREFLYDLENSLDRFLYLRERNLRRWHRNAPFACHIFSGCQFREVCGTNLNPGVLATDFIREPWEPWAGITDVEDVDE